MSSLENLWLDIQKDEKLNETLAGEITSQFELLNIDEEIIKNMLDPADRQIANDLIENTFIKAVEILDEKGLEYLVQWDGKDGKGEEWRPSWVWWQLRLALEIQLINRLSKAIAYPLVKSWKDTARLTPVGLCFEFATSQTGITKAIRYSGYDPRAVGIREFPYLRVN